MENRVMTSPGKTFAHKGGAIAAAIGVVSIASIVFPRSAAALEPSGTVQLRIVQASFIGSASKGGGVLHFQGHNYKFTTTGGGIGGFGLSKFEATGTVYNLKSVADFDGPYLQLRTGLAIGEQGKGKMWLGNPQGVSMALSGRRRGLAVSLGADALVVTLAK
jgi:hypothetical protein